MNDFPLIGNGWPGICASYGARPKLDLGASSRASPLGGSTAGELIPELAPHGLLGLIELEVAAVLGTDRNEVRIGYRNS